MKKFQKKYGQLIFNVCFSFYCLAWIGYQTWKTWQAGRMDYVEISFTVQNLIFAGLILIRKKHLLIDKNLFHQSVSTIAFFSGIAFIGQPVTGQQLSQIISQWLILISNLLGIICLINLGRSFGILIALREIKTNGLYSLVRHPMYFTDILLRIGYLVSHFNPYAIILFTISSACYVYRAVLEERFLSQTTEYRQYMETVKYRFIPYVF